MYVFLGKWLECSQYSNLISWPMGASENLIYMVKEMTVQTLGLPHPGPLKHDYTK